MDHGQNEEISIARDKTTDRLGLAMSYIFGPVPSRRLGRSLGIDVIPPKTCSFDCIYCESGPTTRLSVKRENFADPSKILAELDAFLRLHPNATDVLTFSSAGEPTLYSGIGELIAAIKKAYPRLPLIVLTNGSLLWEPEVRRCLLKADRVVPSLDAVTAGVFHEINRPHPSLEPGQIIEGIRAFRADYKGQLHIEIVLVSGVNDSPEELSALARIIEPIGPDKVELNTVVRPPACTGTLGLTKADMARAASFFSSIDTETVGAFRARAQGCGEEELGARIVETVGRRPCTMAELAASLGVPEKMVELESARLQSQGKLTVQRFDGKLFLRRAK
ncbi:MAG: radical SAM protein [Syntrophobacteraceae bacterium]|jgi:wyosine [tRNA(Phe)-imidazoG37] synthetase (radical SAM superfamily)